MKKHNYDKFCSMLNLNRTEFDDMSFRMKNYIETTTEKKGFFDKSNVKNMFFILNDILKNSTDIKKLKAEIKNKDIKFHLEKIIDYRKENRGYLFISKKTKIPKSTVERYCKKLNI